MILPKSLPKNFKKWGYFRVLYPAFMWFLFFISIPGEGWDSSDDLTIALLATFWMQADYRLHVLRGDYRTLRDDHLNLLSKSIQFLNEHMKLQKDHEALRQFLATLTPKRLR